MPRKSLSPLLLAAAIAASASVHAQPPACGMTLYNSVVLTADMVCPPGVDGLVIGDDNIRIDLNGYSIPSPNRVGTRGIRSSGFGGLKIVGPGSITGFFYSVMIEGGNYHEIRELDAVGTGGISLRNTSGSVVEKNRLAYLALTAEPGYRASANRIGGNRSGTITVGGCQADGNEIANNEIRPGTFMAIGLYGTTGTQVIANLIVNGTVWLGGSIDSLVAHNTIVNTAPTWAHAGVIMVHNQPSPCGAFAPAPAFGNVVRGNAIEGATFGVLMATGSHMNKVVDNKIYGQLTAGLSFNVNSDDNDARGNWYSNVPVTVVDLGRGNLWP